MASTAQNEDNSSAPTIRISILSPSPEVPEPLVFDNVPVSETIGDLKSRIQEAVPSRPAFDKQRIIYKGRALVQHDLPLHSVLVNETINSGNTFNFHLVLSPINTSNINSTRPDGLHQPTGLPSLPLSSSLNQALNMPPRPASTSQMPEPGRAAAGLPQNLPANAFPGMMPPGFPHGPSMGFHMQFTPNTRPIFPSHLHPGLNIPGNPMTQPVGAPAPWLHDPQVQMAMAQHQLLHQQFQQDMMNRGRNATRFENPPGSHPTSQPPPPFPSRDANGVRTALSTPGTVTPPPNQVHPPSSAESAGVSSRPSSTSRHLHPSGSLASIHAANMHAIRQNQLQNMQLDQSAQFNQLRNAIGNPFPAMRPAVTSTPTVYLLSSPHGPEAILMSSSGTFTSPGYSSVSRLPSQPEQGSTTITHTHNNQATPTIPAPVPTPTVPQAQQVPQQAPQVRQQQRQDQAGDLLRILLPLGGQLWLIVRIIGFVYLFSIGRGWRNAVLLGTIAFIGFLAQMGIFNPLLRTVWQPIREHVDGIINPERVSDPQNLTPQQIADRIMRDRRANENVVRRTARRAERSAILFAASLIPGVGESQVRARENLNRLVREAGEAAERARLLAEQAEQAEQQTEHDGEDKQAEKEDIPTTEEEPANVAQDPADQRLVDVD